MNRNATHRLQMTPSEFCDMVAVDHLTGNLRHLAQLVAKTPEVDIDIRTKASQLDDIRSFSGYGRITFAIALNTEYIISKYEHGTASLDERLSAARTVQEADGYDLDLVIEPFIKYDDCIQDYVALVGRIAKAIDLKRVKKISLGSARYRKQLRERIIRNFPATDLFLPSQSLQEPEQDDYRLRYSLDYLTDVYTIIQKEIAKYAPVPISLGAEKPELWQRMQLDAGEHISKSVYQFSETAMAQKQSTPNSDQKEKSEETSMPITFKSEKSISSKKDEIEPDHETGIMEENRIDKSERSIFYECALKGIVDLNQEINVDKFDLAEQQLSDIVYTDEPFTAQDGSKALISFDLWDTVEPVTVRTARSPENLWHPVKIMGRLLSLTEVKPVEIMINGENKTLPSRVLTFVDKEQQRFQTLNIPESSLPANVDQLLRSQKLVTFLGCCVSIKIKQDDLYRFYLRKLIDFTSMSDLVARPKSKDHDDKFKVTLSSGNQIGIPVDHPYLLVDRYGYSEKHKRDGMDLFNYIKNSLMQNLKILGVGQGAKHLERGLEFVILQALSQGKSDGFSNKLHGLIIGQPNVGKSKLTSAAKDINPISNEMSVTGAKHTAAGKIGKVKEVKGVTLSIGGILPSSSGGVVYIQDFNRLTGGARKAFFDICSLLMEQSVVRDDTSANATLEAEVSLLVDTNRYHQTEKNHPPKPNTYADLDIPIHILSRFDFILEIPEDSKRQELVSEEMELNSTSTAFQWQSELKDLIAFLRDNYGDIVIPEGIDEYANVELRKIYEKYKSAHFENIIDNHRIRIKRSLKKYLLAISRALARPVITKDHVDFAMKFIEEKISFLASQEYGDSSIDGRSKQKEDRRKLILENFGDREFTRTDLSNFYSEIFSDSERFNISRDLNDLKEAKLIDQVRHGHWKVVSSDEPKMPQKIENAKKKAVAKPVRKTMIKNTTKKKVIEKRIDKKLIRTKKK